jgi:tRNA pseudouridine38-40 synthase
VTLFEGDAERPSASDGGVVPRVRVRLTIAYDGSGFHGFAANAGVRTVGGTLADAVERVLGTPIELTCAGRTDAGVHAWGQVVSFDAPAPGFDPDGLQRSLNKMCGPEIVVRKAAVVDPDFDARFSALARTYRYSILNRPVPDPFLAHLAWHVDRPLDIDLLRLGSDPLIGEHDFSAFCRRPKRHDGEPASLVRKILHAGWQDLGNGLLRFEISANAFCHQMVRSIVGTLVEVGMARLHAGDVLSILAQRDRAAAGPVAPPHGLCLWQVEYPSDRKAAVAR